MGSSKHGVYALTITVTKEIHERMLLDNKLTGLEIVRDAYIGVDYVHIKSKIGETTNASKRLNGYKTSRKKNGMYFNV